MSEPITLYRDGEALTVTAPSFARELQAAGWTLDRAESYDDVPFTLRDAPEAAEDEPEVAPAPKRRGRKPKAKA